MLSLAPIVPLESFTLTTLLRLRPYIYMNYVNELMVHTSGRPNPTIVHFYPDYVSSTKLVATGEKISVLDISPFVAVIE